jgi:hypothetical protein
MNDMIFILKMCGNAISILILLEISVYLTVNRKGRASRLKTNYYLSKSTVKIYNGFISCFLFGILGILMYILETRLWYLNPGMGVGSGTVYNWYQFFGNMTIYWFNLAFISVVSTLGSLSTKKIYSFSNIIKFLCLISFIIIPYDIFIIFNYVILPIGILFLLVICSMVKNSSGKFRVQFVLMLIGFILFTFGVFSLTHIFDQMLLLMDSFLSELIFLCSLIIIALASFSLPSIMEVFAPNFIEELFIADSTGKIITRVVFDSCNVKNNVNDINSNQIDSILPQDDGSEMLTTTIVGIDGILHEMSSAKGLLKTLVHQNKIMIIEKTPSLIGVLITRIELHTHRGMLTNFLKKIESIYSNQLQNQVPSINVEMSIKSFISVNYVGDFNLKSKKLWKIN